MVDQTERTQPFQFGRWEMRSATFAHSNRQPRAGGADGQARIPRLA